MTQTELLDGNALVGTHDEPDELRGRVPVTEAAVAPRRVHPLGR